MQEEAKHLELRVPVLFVALLAGQARQVPMKEPLEGPVLLPVRERLRALGRVWPLALSHVS